MSLPIFFNMSYINAFHKESTDRDENSKQIQDNTQMIELIKKISN
jgi:hypothetical protein